MLSESMVIFRQGGARRCHEPIPPSLLTRITRWQYGDSVSADVLPMLIQLIIDGDDRLSPSQRGLRRLAVSVRLDDHVSSSDAVQWGVAACETYKRLMRSEPNRDPCLVDAPPDRFCTGQFIAAFFGRLYPKRPKIQYENLGKGVALFFAA